MYGALKTLIAAAAAAMMMTLGYSALAQEKKAPAPAPAAKTAPAKPKSACNAVATEAACKADSTCQWIAALVDDKGKQKRKAYCRTAPKPPAKKEPKK